jgi:hypothetical protein
MKEAMTTSEKNVVVVLALKNVGQVPLAFVTSWLGGQYEVKYVPNSSDPTRKTNTWTRGILRGTSHSGEPSRYAPGDYMLIAPGREFRTEVNVGSYLRGLSPEGLMPGKYVLTFWYSYEANDAEADLPLISFASAPQPVTINVTDE